MTAPMGGGQGGIWLRPSIVLAGVSLAAHAVAGGNYGFFRDELYFIVCGGRPDFGYVDQPPVVPLLAAGVHALTGDFLWGFRLVPALLMSAAVGASAEFARVIGAGRFAQWLTALCVLTAPVFLLMGGLFFTEMFQPLTWLGLAWALVRLEQTRDQRWWVVFGAIAGFSLNTKYAIAFYLAGLAIGLLFTPHPLTALRRPWIYLGACLAAAMLLPNVLWQAARGWPFLELGKAGVGGKNLAMSLPQFLLQQVIYIGPWAAPVWLVGLWACLAKPPLKTARAFAVAWLVLTGLFVALHGKPYYPAAAYPALLAFGAQRIEAWTLGPKGARQARGAGLAVVAGLGVLVAPFTLPVLPVQAFVRYQKAIGFMPDVGENTRSGLLPQYYADMFGWREMAARVAAVYHALPPKDRASAVFYGENYGQAAAIDVFGRKLGLPPAISGQNQYFLWGPRGHDGRVIIIVGGDPKHYAELFGRFDVAGRIDAAYARPGETNQPIYVLRDMKTRLPLYWPQTKSYR